LFFFVPFTLSDTELDDTELDESWFESDEAMKVKQTRKERGAASYALLKKDTERYAKYAKMKHVNERIKFKEDPVYRQTRQQQKRISKTGRKEASKQLAIDSGTRGKHLSDVGVALVKNRYIAWRDSHESMVGFYLPLCKENHDCLNGYCCKINDSKCPTSP
jgi:hypothetical protein